MNPLHYKRLVTRRRLHIVYCSFLVLLCIEITIATGFFRRDENVITNQQCLLSKVLHATAYLLVSTANFYLSVSVLLICYIIITIKLRKRSIIFASASDVNSKVTRASWLAVTAFIILYTPSNLFTMITNFVEPPHPIPMTFFLDISYLLYNVVNPMIYYVTLNDFREGYVSALKCRFSKVTEKNQDTQTSVTSVTS